MRQFKGGKLSNDEGHDWNAIRNAGRLMTGKLNDTASNNTSSQNVLQTKLDAAVKKLTKSSKGKNNKQDSCELTSSEIEGAEDYIRGSLASEKSISEIDKGFDNFGGGQQGIAIGQGRSSRQNNSSGTPWRERLIKFSRERLLNRLNNYDADSLVNMSHEDFLNLNREFQYLQNHKLIGDIDIVGFYKERGIDFNNTLLTRLDQGSSIEEGLEILSNLRQSKVNLGKMDSFHQKIVEDLANKQGGVNQIVANNEIGIQARDNMINDLESNLAGYSRAGIVKDDLLEEISDLSSDDHWQEFVMGLLE